MSKVDKRLDGMRQNPAGGWRIKDVEAVCEAYEIRCSPPKRGDHYKISHPSQNDILTIPAKRPIKPVYIRRLLAFVDRVQEEDK